MEDFEVDTISHSQAICPVPGPDEILASWQLFIVEKYGFSSSNNVLIITVWNIAGVVWQMF